mmetsp:Transcript_32404/g.79023  ORF Transcript_32404/g.79023 Transcript_32404/m.79023 type:complete len:188 (+) Transcript_32404:125-688(+)
MKVQQLTLLPLLATALSSPTVVYARGTGGGIRGGGGGANTQESGRTLTSQSCAENEVSIDFQLKLKEKVQQWSFQVSSTPETKYFSDAGLDQNFISETVCMPRSNDDLITFYAGPTTFQNNLSSLTFSIDGKVVVSAKADEFTDGDDTEENLISGAIEIKPDNETGDPVVDYFVCQQADGVQVDLKQ